MIKELLGREKENSEEAYIYTEDGEKKEINECKKEFITNWTQQVYQKLERASFTFWDDEKNGQRKEMIKKMEEEGSGIMENPIITEKEFVDTINNMKNGKASGVDNIPAEVMKALIKDDQARSYLLMLYHFSYY